MLSTYLEILQHGSDLSQEQSYECLLEIFNGSIPQHDIEHLLRLLRDKGEAVDELVGFAKAMREKMLPIELNTPAMDLCGTGGMQQVRFNVSTAAAFVISAAGVPVAKHGNRGSLAPNGSFDFLEALGISFELPIDKIQSLFKETNLCFLFARQFHKAVSAVALARKVVGGRTIFNMLGPLCNPAKVTHQVIGTTTLEIGEKLAAALHQLGTKRSLVIVGEGGMDELSMTGRSKIFDVTPDAITPMTYVPPQKRKDSSEIKIGDAKTNAELFKHLLFSGDVEHPISRLICLNVGVALYCWGASPSIDQGADVAVTLVQSKKAWDTYENYKGFSVTC